MNNLSLSPLYSKFYFSPKSVGIKDEEAIISNGDLLAKIKASYTKNKVLQFLVECEEVLTKRELLYLLVVCAYYSEDFNFLAEEQKNYYPTNPKVRVGCRSDIEKQASQPDVTRIELMRKGYIEYTGKLGGVRFSYKIYLMFCLHELNKKRKELIESGYLRMITEQDFTSRVEIEKQILEIEKQIKEFKPTKEGQPQPRKKRAVKNKKPLKLGASGA